MNPFDYLNTINVSKQDIMVDTQSEKGYAAFMVNRGLSYFVDTVLIANEMNQAAHLDNRLQYDFLRHIVRKKKRFSKWHKASDVDNIELIKLHYGYNNQRAKEALRILPQDEIERLKEMHGHRHG